ncbi:hypothetical protein [Methanobacterium virus PhiF3]|nr:hypothetical protein [Methanobacterium virus PhiF3]
MSKTLDRFKKAKRLKVKLLGEVDEGLLFEVQGSNGPYTVLLNPQGVSCNCKDYEYRSLTADGYSYICKHVWAVMIHISSGGWL